MSKILFCFVLLFSSVYTFALTPSVAIKNIINNDLYSVSFGRTALKQGDYLYIIGDSEYFDEEDPSIMTYSGSRVIKMDLDLNIIWDKSYTIDTTYNPVETVNDAILANDSSGIVLLGSIQYSSAEETYSFVRKIDFDGNEIYANKYQNMTNEGGRLLEGKDIKYYNNGYIISGKYTDSDYNTSALVLKVDANGTELSRDTLETSYNSHEDFSYTYSNAIAPTSDGGYVLGANIVFAVYSDQKQLAYIQKYTSDNELDWNITIENEYDTTLLDILVEDDILYVNTSSGFYGAQIELREYNATSGTLERTESMYNVKGLLHLENGDWLFHGYDSGYNTNTSSNYTDLRLDKRSSSFSTLYNYINDDSYEYDYAKYSYDSVYHIGKFIEIGDGEYIAPALSSYYRNFAIFRVSENEELEDYNALSISQITSANVGWSLLGAQEDITDMSIFGNGIVWKYENNVWKIYSSDESLLESVVYEEIQTISEGEGFWYLKK